ncbi:hypothetical protein Slin14017_G121280 [Septoria linicola]|nr:hypothetical protein Slin14017_G121280 [Septoria linicola]
MKLFAALLLALPFADAESCGIVGNPIANRAYYSKKNAKFATQKNCAARCKKDAKCKGYGVGKETCKLYTSKVYDTALRLFAFTFANNL